MKKQEFAVDIRPGSVAGTVVISVSGSLVLEHLFQFQEIWEKHDEPLLILDASRMSYIDSAALGFLVRAYVSRGKNGRKLALVGVSGFVLQLLHATRVSSLFNSYSTVEEAEAALAVGKTVGA